MIKTIDEIDFKKGGGLVPVVTQDATSLEVLTLAYANQEAVTLSLETGWAHYYRRSHGRVTKKGVTSGNIQKIHRIMVDCDFDALIYIVDQKGPACHLGERSCFHNKLEID